MYIVTLSEGQKVLHTPILNWEISLPVTQILNIFFQNKTRKTPEVFTLVQTDDVSPIH